MKKDTEKILLEQREDTVVDFIVDVVLFFIVAVVVSALFHWLDRPQGYSYLERLLKLLFAYVLYLLISYLWKALKKKRNK